MSEPVEIFPWNENFVGGIPQIDEQHKKLVHLVNKLAGSLVDEAGTSCLNDVFNELADYAVYHFQTEEDIWQQSLAGDEWEAGHKKSHQSFVSDVLRLKNEKSSRPLNEVLENVLSFLTHWLAFHILDSDKHMAKIVLALQSGKSLEQAKQQAHQEMGGATEVLIEAILSMYDTLSRRTLQMMKEVIERKHAEELLHQQKQLSDDIIDSLPGIFYVLDQTGKFVRINSRFIEVTGYSNREIERMTALDIFDGEEKNLIAKRMQEVFETGDASVGAELLIKSGQKIPYYFTGRRTFVGDQCYLVGVGSDITELRELELKLTQQARTDALTGLANRRHFIELAQKEMVRAIRFETMLSALMLDLDKFKEINDAFGHQIGDDVLRKVSDTCRKTLREIDIVGRIGGEEFAILLPESDTQQAIEVAERLRQEIAKVVIPLAQDGKVSVTASIGLATLTGADTSVDMLLNLADKALYEAKRTGRNRVCVNSQPLPTE